jgi:antirestriction protein ArdC
MADARKTNLQPKPCGIIRIAALWTLCRYRHKGHWTGHPDRLDRTFGKRFGDDAYAFEELCAEMTSALLGADLGLPTSHMDDHAAYIGSWLKVLRKDSRAIMTAAAKAEAAAGYLLRATGLDASVEPEEQIREAA